MRCLLLVPMSREMQYIQRWFPKRTPLQDALFSVETTQLPHAEILLATCGIGKVNAAICAYKLISDYHPDYLFNIGVCGALASGCAPGDIVASQQLVYHDVWCGEPNAYGQIQGLPPSYSGAQPALEALAHSDIPCRSGLFCCGEYFVPTPSEIERIKAHFPQALAVDMESTAIAQVAYLTHTPYLSVRIVSDTPIEALDHKAQYNHFWATQAEEAFAKLGELIIATINHLK